MISDRTGIVYTRRDILAVYPYLFLYDLIEIHIKVYNQCVNRKY